MTTYTINEFATRVLKDLGTIAAEETPSATHLADAVEICQSEILLLNSKGIPVWNGSEVTIPQVYLTTLSRRCGLAVAPSYGLVDMATATTAMEVLERDLRTLAQTGPTHAILANDYF